MDLLLAPFRIIYALIMFAIGITKRLVYGLSFLFSAGNQARKSITAATQRELTCPKGHVQPAEGSWQCECGFKREGSAWKECPSCHRIFNHVDCRECGLSIVNPAAWFAPLVST